MKYTKDTKLNHVIFSSVFMSHFVYFVPFVVRVWVFVR